MTRHVVEFHDCDVCVPGFVDIHTHGVGGAFDVMDYWKDPSYTQLAVVEHGCTSLLATVVFSDSSPENRLQCCAKLHKASGRQRDLRGAIIEGIHAEGPIIHSLGGLPSSAAFCEMDEKAFCKLLDDISGPNGLLRIMTISPSLETGPSGPWRIKLLMERGVVVSLGHDRDCTEAQILSLLRLSRRMHNAFT